MTKHSRKNEWTNKQKFFGDGVNLDEYWVLLEFTNNLLANNTHSNVKRQGLILLLTKTPRCTTSLEFCWFFSRLWRLWNILEFVWSPPVWPPPVCQRSPARPALPQNTPNSTILTSSQQTGKKQGIAGITNKTHNGWNAAKLQSAAWYHYMTNNTPKTENQLVGGLFGLFGWILGKLVPGGRDYDIVLYYGKHIVQS